MSNIVFQRPRGTSWKFKWTDSYDNLVQPGTAPGYESRVSLGPDTIRTLELSWAILVTGSRGCTLDQLIGFFNLRQADYDSFLVDLGSLCKRPECTSIIGQVLNVDSNGYAPIQVSHYVSPEEDWWENIYELAGVNGNPGTAPVLYLDGVPMVPGTDYNFYGPGYSIPGETWPGLMVIISKSLGSPAGVVTADFSWYYRVRFEQGKQDFDMFHYLLWTAEQIRVVVTRT